MARRQDATHRESVHSGGSSGIAAYACVVWLNHTIQDPFGVNWTTRNFHGATAVYCGGLP